MYTQADFDMAEKCGANALRTLALAAVASAAIALPFFFMRVLWAAAFATSVAGIATLIWWDAYGAPAVRYSRFMRGISEGLEHEVTAVLQSVSDEDAEYGGIPCRAVYVMLEVEERKSALEDEAVCFYADRRAALPELTPGKAVRVRYSGRVIKEIEAVS